MLKKTVYVICWLGILFYVLVLGNIYYLMFTDMDALYLIVPQNKWFAWLGIGWWSGAIVIFLLILFLDLLPKHRKKSDNEKDK